MEGKKMSMISLSKNVSGNIKIEKLGKIVLFGLRRRLKVSTKYFHQE
jgi:hypothetical protein